MEAPDAVRSGGDAAITVAIAGVKMTQCVDGGAGQAPRPGGPDETRDARMGPSVVKAARRTPDQPLA